MNIEINFNDFEYWWKMGNTYQIGKLKEKSILISRNNLIKEPIVNNIEDFIYIFNASNFFLLYKYPIEIYVYSYIYIDEVIEYLNNKNGVYENIFLEKLEENILKNKKEILDFMKFNINNINKYYVKEYKIKIKILEITDFIDLKYIINFNNKKIELIYNFEFEEKILKLKDISILKHISELLINYKVFKYQDISFENINDKFFLFLFNNNIVIRITQLNIEYYSNYFKHLYNKCLKISAHF